MGSFCLFVDSFLSAIKNRNKIRNINMKADTSMQQIESEILKADLFQVKYFEIIIVYNLHIILLLFFHY